MLLIIYKGHTMNHPIIDAVVSETFFRKSNESTVKTPWGKADTEYPIERGVTWYSTPGHGGLSVAKGVAMRRLSPHARELGELWGNSYWYEEDVAWNLAFYENPDWQDKLKSLSGGSKRTKEQMEDSIKRYYPQYFEEEFRGKSERKQNLPKLQIGDVIIMGERMRHDKYTVITIQGKKTLVSTEDGKRYRMPENYIMNYAIKIERDNKAIWTKD